MKFGKQHGTPVPFQDKDGKIYTFISNRWWSRHRKRNPIKLFRSKTLNIETEFEKRYGNQTRIKKGWWKGLFEVMRGWFKMMFS